MRKKVYKKQIVQGFSSRKNKAVISDFVNVRGQQVSSTNINTYQKDKLNVFYRRERIKTKKGYRVRAYQLLNSADVRLGKPAKERLVKSVKGGSFKKLGKLPFLDVNKVTSFKDGKDVYEFNSKQRPNRTGKNKRGEQYTVQFTGYYKATKGRRSVIVFGASNGFATGVKRPDNKHLEEQARERARGEAGRLFQSSNFTLELIEKGWRYFGVS